MLFSPLLSSLLMTRFDVLSTSLAEIDISGGGAMLANLAGCLSPHYFICIMENVIFSEQLTTDTKFTRISK